MQMTALHGNRAAFLLVWASLAGMHTTVCASRRTHEHGTPGVATECLYRQLLELNCWDLRLTRCVFAENSLMDASKTSALVSAPPRAIQGQKAARQQRLRCFLRTGVHSERADLSESAWQRDRPAAER